jgi:4-hydroxy-3-polyprenylbenzoate decarboxylase
MRIVVGITGASGAILGVRCLEALRELGVETHLVMSRWSKATILAETAYLPDQVQALASVLHSVDDLAASVSSGSFRTDGMVVAPCSMKTLAAIRSGYSDNLISRAADVILKERRKLVLLTRESPLSAIHLENMLALTRMGAVIMPPVPSFYTKPETVDDIVHHLVGRVLDQFGLELPDMKRWTGVGRARA